MILAGPEEVTDKLMETEDVVLTGIGEVMCVVRMRGEIRAGMCTPTGAIFLGPKCTLGHAAMLHNTY